MISRNINFTEKSSVFLFGPRGVGKSCWLKTVFPGNIYIDLLDDSTYRTLLSSPDSLRNRISSGYTDWIIIDEIQKVPLLLNEIHRLIEEKGMKFIMTGSSPRKLRKEGVNLLGGRALIRYMYPLSALELKDDFDIGKALNHGMLPSLYDKQKDLNPSNYLNAYINAYLKEEIYFEGITRNLGSFTRFLESASFSQAQLLNISEVSRECAVNRKVVENYFNVLDDLLIATRIPAFTKRAQRKIVQHPKFFFFDTGVYRQIRPKGPLDSTAEIDGQALETLVFQELRAAIGNLGLELNIYYWRTVDGAEVDFVLYGNDGFACIEVKRKKSLGSKDLSGIRSFLMEYPEAKPYVFYGGNEMQHISGIEIWPIEKALRSLNLIVKTRTEQVLPQQGVNES
jgi:predicted AAA+ superfamily ATPase